jgi:hypothetical protein
LKAKTSSKLPKRRFRQSVKRRAWYIRHVSSARSTDALILKKKAIAANSLLSITHSLKLMFLLGDEEYITQRRQERLKTAVTDITTAKARFEKAWDGLKGPRVLTSKEFAQKEEQRDEKGDVDMKM